MNTVTQPADGTTADAATSEIDTVVIGAGQAGLATGYHLARLGLPFVILEADDRVGECWHKRFDCLRLYSPARNDGLPGMEFPGDQWSFPTKTEMGDYLAAYAERFELPVRTGVTVERLGQNEDRYVVDTNEGQLSARQVVVASGTFQEPIVPEFASELDPSIHQIHSSEYRNPSSLRPGPALVVGASHSGSDIAYDIGAIHETVLCGPAHEIPFNIESRPARTAWRLLWFIANHVLTMRTPLGRKARPEIRAHGGPLLRIKLADLAERGVEHTEHKVIGAEDGKPVLADGRVLEVANVVWCTGFDKDTSWIELPVNGEDGWPEQERGAATQWPGLYFVGLPFLYAFSSMLVGGAGRDAKAVAKQIDASTLAHAGIEHKHQALQSRSR